MNPDANLPPQQSVGNAQARASSVHVDRPQAVNPQVGNISAVPQNPAPQQVITQLDGEAQAVVSTPVAQSETSIQRKTFVLPYQLVSKGDLSRCLRELSTIDDFFHQAAIRGSKEQIMPTLGKVLDSLAKVNQLSMLKPEDRASLKSFLTKIKQNAPVVHLSLPSEPSAAFLAKILEWFRTEVHPYTVLYVGMQPNLVAGCLVRTTNKSFDFSFRKKFEVSKEKLMASLHSTSTIDQTEGSNPNSAHQVAVEPVSTDNVNPESSAIIEGQPVQTVVSQPSQSVERLDVTVNNQSPQGQANPGGVA